MPSASIAPLLTVYKIRELEEQVDSFKKEINILQQHVLSSKKELLNITTPRGMSPQSTPLASAKTSTSGILNRKHQEIKELKKKLAHLEEENKSLQGKK